mmetsp:Transcript_38786/g.97449  ORF Transcript_38786/g.97449 Transcript_38786/m.97449 type:complete len:497 (+) Transcript_38786:136-1626(+)
MTKEVEMKDATEVEKEAGSGDKAAAPAAPEPTPAERCKGVLTECTAILGSAVTAKETKLLAGRVLRKVASIRKELDAPILREFLGDTLPAGSAALSLLLSSLSKAEGAMDTDAAATAGDADPASVLPEVEIFCYLLVIMCLVDKKMFAEGRDISTTAVTRIGSFNRRTLDVLAARVYHYYSWCHESTGQLDSIRSTLLALQRTATLRHDEIGAETLLNLLLRNYLHFNLYDQAEKLRAKAQQPDASRSSQQYARYLYYMGRIRAIQLEYTEAKECLQQAARKAPGVAKGFRTSVNKWLVLVRLLLGDTPERADFNQPGMVKAMEPYFKLTQAVRVGDLNCFRAVAEQFDAVFRADKTANLIVRLRHNVIRTGLRRINLAYSRISFAEIGAKLGLAEGDDVECIVAKAIRDGGIDAVLNHERGCMESSDVVDIYSTHEPMAAFHSRVSFCLDLHNEAVRAMRFEPDAHKKSLESAEARKERLQQEAELAQQIQEDDF